MQINKTQAAVVATAIVAVLVQPEIQATLPPKVLVWVLAVTNVLSALLPKLANTGDKK
jgi:hypothetical protein